MTSKVPRANQAFLSADRQRTLQPGTRVRVHGSPSGMTLQSALGEIVSVDHYWDDFYIVHLDQPALHHDPDGSGEECSEIREAADNLTIVIP